MARQMMNDEERHLDALCRHYLREPVWYIDEALGGPQPSFDPPLSAAEQTRLGYLRRLARVGGVLITPDERETLEPVIDRLRTNRTRTDAQWAALTAAQRDTALISWCRDLTDILRAMLRD